MRIDLLNQIVLQWDCGADCTGIIKTGGIEALWLQRSDDPIESACRAAGAEPIAAGAIRLVGLDWAGEAPGAMVEIKAAVWPGAHATSRGSDSSLTAGASQRARVDATSTWLRGCRRYIPGFNPCWDICPTPMPAFPRAW